MGVYVDDCVWPFRNMMMCHMWADTEEELHEMVDKIGLNRKWWQRSSAGIIHYDLAKSKRKLAIEYGAIEFKTLTLEHKRKLLKMNRPNQ